MAIVNLSSVFKKPKNPNSSIRYLYQDWEAASMEVLRSDNISAKKDKSDLLVDYDIKAVTNSIANILTTKKRQKILEPEFGLRLEDYLFEPVSDSVASLIEDEIREVITVFEPRVNLQDVRVIPFYDENKYEINIYFNIPTLKQSVSLKGNVDNGVVTVL